MPGAARKRVKRRTSARSNLGPFDPPSADPAEPRNNNPPTRKKTVRKIGQGGHENAAAQPGLSSPYQLLQRLGTFSQNLIQSVVPSQPPNQLGWSSQPLNQPGAPSQQFNEPGAPSQLFNQQGAPSQ
eukprot:537168_1